MIKVNEANAIIKAIADKIDYTFNSKEKFNINVTDIRVVQDNIHNTRIEANVNNRYIELTLNTIDYDDYDKQNKITRICAGRQASEVLNKHIVNICKELGIHVIYGIGEPIGECYFVYTNTIINWKDFIEHLYEYLRPNIDNNSKSFKKYEYILEIADKLAIDNADAKSILDNYFGLFIEEYDNIDDLKDIVHLSNYAVDRFSQILK